MTYECQILIERNAFNATENGLHDANKLDGTDTPDGFLRTITAPPLHRLNNTAHPIDPKRLTT